MNQAKGKHEKLNNIIELIEESDISSIKNVVSGLVKIINDPKSTAKDLKELIQIDPPLTAKMLRLANSAYYSPRNKIGELHQAIVWVGYDAIKELALSQKVCEIFRKDKSFEGYSRNSLWKHSLAVALFAKMIYRREFGNRGENVYAAGLLHDIGIIAEDQFYQDEFKITLNKLKNEKKNLIRAEYEVFGFEHSEVGKAIIDYWQIPQEIGVAIGSHHNPDKAGQEFSKISYTLYVADNFCQEKDIGYGDAPFEDNVIFEKCLRKLDIEHHALDLIIEDVEQEILKMEEQGFFR